MLVKAANCWLLVDRALVASGCGAWPWAAKKATLKDSEAAKGTPDPDRVGHEEGTQIGRPIVDLAPNP